MLQICHNSIALRLWILQRYGLKLLQFNKSFCLLYLDMYEKNKADRKMPEIRKNFNFVRSGDDNILKIFRKILA